MHGVHETAILHALPDHLRKEVSSIISRSIWSNVPFFKACDKATFETLVGLLEPATYLPGDCIARCGQYGKEMYLLERGLVQVTSADRKLTYGLLRDGDYFGEGALLTETVRMATVVALVYCDCFVLGRDALYEALELVAREQRTLVLTTATAVFKRKQEDNKKVAENIRTHRKLSLTMGFESSGLTNLELPDSSWRHPSSAFRYVWDLLILLVLLWNVFAIPYRIAFLPPTAGAWSFLPDYLMDLVLVLDITAAHNVFAYMHEGQIISARVAIRENHRRKRQTRINAVSLLPWELVGLLCMSLGSEDLQRRSMLVLSIARVPKVCVTLQLLHYAR